jgi:ABC-type uncharacterized transport system involved in gliding motility auxiliary subunit
MERRLVILFAVGVVLLAFAALLSATRGGFGGWSAGLVTAGAVVWTLAVVISWRGITRYLLKRSTRYGLNAMLLSFFVAVILFMIGFIGDRHSWRRDYSATQEFTLSEKTLNVLQGIRKPVDIYVYYERGSRDAVRDLLVEYTRRNRGLQIRIEDLNKNPELAERFGVTELGTIVFDAGDKLLRLRTFGEEDITNALIKVSRPGQKQVCFLTGHGEKSVEDKGVFGYSIAAMALRRENYRTENLDLVAAGEVPDDCDILAVAGAKSGVLDQEIQAIRRYMQRGGRLFCLFDPRFQSNLEGWVAVWGIHVGNDRIVDPSPTGQLLGRGPTTPLVNRYGAHAITKQFREPTYFQNARSVRRLQLYQGVAETAALVFSSAQSWAETKVFSSQVGFDEEDLAGPVSIAMAARVDIEGLHPELDAAVVQIPGDEVVSREALKGVGSVQSTEARVVVFGDSDFATNQSFNDMGNGNLFQNCIAWLAEDEDLIAVRPKVARSRSVTLSLAQLKVINAVAIFVLPGIVLVFALAVLLRRRARG